MLYADARPSLVSYFQPPIDAGDHDRSRANLRLELRALWLIEDVLLRRVRNAVDSRKRGRRELVEP
jgi:hypothetical protein